MGANVQRMEQVVRGVLLSLWRRPEGTMQGLLEETTASIAEVREALRILVVERKCVIEQSPAMIRLVSTGIGCWGDVVESLGLRMGKRVRVFTKTSSTNDVAWQFAGEGTENDGVMVVAEEQTAGRGRLGREWVAKRGQAVLMSVLLRENAGLEEEGFERMTLLAGLAVAEGIERAVGGEGPRAEIKWPNDVLVCGKKIAGILVERRRVGDSVYCVVGIGVNVGQGSGDFGAALAGRATSLYQVLGKMVDRLRVVVGVAESLEARVGQAGDGWVAEWKGRCGMLGSAVEARESGGDLIKGKVVDVDPMRGLVVRDAGGRMHFLRGQTTTLSV